MFVSREGMIVDGGVKAKSVYRGHRGHWGCRHFHTRTDMNAFELACVFILANTRQHGH